jgi:CheY-like chemotaxis protein
MCLSQRFTRLGYSVLTAADGKEALSCITKERPDITILDVMMPVMNGLSLLTAKSQQENILEGLAGGANDYITKPFDVDEVGGAGVRCFTASCIGKGSCSCMLSLSMLWHIVIGASLVSLVIFMGLIAVRFVSDMRKARRCARINRMEQHLLIHLENPLKDIRSILIHDERELVLLAELAISLLRRFARKVLPTIAR